MTYVIKYSSVLLTKNKIESRFGGSSKFKVLDDELIEKKIKQKRKERKELKKKDVNEKESLLCEENEKESKIGSDENAKKGYSLNKAKIKRKCHAFSRLEKSKKFLAFYSISFPMGLKDDLCYKLFNTWLTRCRKNSGLQSYLWVAERQKNRTIHFHLLTNDYMPIKIVNSYMAAAIATQKKKGIVQLKSVDTEKYNGVDVKKVGNDRKALINYLAKYITKNEIEFYRLPWHCSRDISRLFTSINFENEESEQYFNQIPRDPKHYTEVKYTKYFNVAGFKFLPNNEVFTDLDGVNELIYNTNK